VSEPCPEDRQAERVKALEVAHGAIQREITLQFEAHEKLHTTADIVRAKTDAELNDVRQRFIAREEYHASNRAIWALFGAIILVLIANMGGLIGILATR